MSQQQRRSFFPANRWNLFFVKPWLFFAFVSFAFLCFVRCEPVPSQTEFAQENILTEVHTMETKEQEKSSFESVIESAQETVQEPVSEPSVPERLEEPTLPEDASEPSEQPPTPDVFADHPPQIGCKTPAANLWKPLQAATHSVGGFLIEVASNNVLQIFHQDAPKKLLFQFSRVSPVVAAQVDLKVEEHQGSFSTEEKLKLECKQSQIDEVAVDGANFSLRGRFLDAAADCKSLSFVWDFCEASRGHLRFILRNSNPTFQSISVQLASTSSERLYGMGVQFPHDQLNLKGKKIPVLVQEGGVGRGHQPISTSVNAASKGSAGSEVSTYYTMPYFMTDRWGGFLLENSEMSCFDFTASDSIQIRLFSNEMQGRILSAASPLETLERLTEYTGRMPPLPDWVNEGAIVALARSLKDSESHVAALLAKGAKIAGVWNQTWPGKIRTFIGEQVLWNWAYNPHYHPDWSAFVQGLQQKNIRVLCYINPMFHDVPQEAGKVTRNLFQEGKADGYFVKNAAGALYMVKVTAFEVALLDLTNPAARTWMKAVIKDEMLNKAGCSGWMADFAEALPFDAVLYSKISASEYHNLYPVEWIKLHREALQESGNLGKVLVFNRSGFTQTSAHSLLLWQGDQLTTWDKYDGLVSALHGLINGGLSGVSLNHSDTGGYTSLSYLGLGYDREAELLKRWAEMNAFTSVLRTHEGNQPELNAQVYSNADAIEHFARMTKIYQALAFYRKQLFQEAQSKGWPVVRHLMLHYPDDVASRAVDDQFLLGSQILVSPVKNKCWTWPACPYEKEVYLPPGRWTHLWTGTTYGSSNQGSHIKVTAPLGKPAVFYLEGSVVGKTFVQNLKNAGFSDVP